MMASVEWKHVVLVLVVVVAAAVSRVGGQCPWQTNMTDLHTACSCSFVLAKLAVRCSSVDVGRLLGVLRDSGRGPPMDSLLVSNSSVPILADDAFYNLRVTTVQFSGCSLRTISANAFRDLDGSLLTLNLPDNELTEGALAPLRKLASLTSLDVSGNRFGRLDDDAFRGLSLDTLNLMDNNLSSIGAHAFRGLELTLKNLNLKSTGQSKLPDALGNLTALAFLDLAQNSIDDLGSAFFQKMDSLTALSLERNRLSRLAPDAFAGLEDSMSSLSLLSNNFETVPIGAVAILKELRVLDLGFNNITTVPDNAFQNITSLTLLALDGNPLSTLSFVAFRHLHATLRGLSVGGRSLVCDCHIRWIAEWVREYDLQVTSRERNPQFCGHPAAQRNKNLYLLRPAQLECPETVTPTTTAVVATTETSAPHSQSTTTATTSITTTTTTTAQTTTASNHSVVAVTATTTTTARSSSPRSPATSSSSSSNNQRSARKNSGHDIRFLQAFRDESTITITWDASNVAGFRVIYRLFGDTVFKEGTVLPQREKKFRMTNVPPSECIVVCVISLAEKGANLTVDNVPSSNCRELRNRQASSGHFDIDKIVIVAASAAICAAVIVAVVVFVCCHRRRDGHAEKVMPPPSTTIVGLPPAPMVESSKPEWDNASAYSSRSIPRARMYHLGRAGGTVNSAFLPDDARSHLSVKHGGGLDDRAHSMIDGHYTTSHTNTLPNPYPLGRPETNRSTKSLAQASYLGTHHKRPQRNVTKWASLAHNSSMQSLNGYNNDSGYFHPNPWSGSEMGHYPREPFNKRDYT